ncbi:AraC family transcriptional regulator [Lysobacter antibioticus]|uniref:AraC family transcriptional regulator n=1 Tax=Lysobacter antibioticus TaxID=84531 RepID=UPI0009E8BB8F
MSANSRIAAQVGYGSEPAFSRGFRRLFGGAPSDYRKRLRAAAALSAPATLKRRTRAR